jgi:NAD(P)-dependent dehydrogenase (short-subunit alcohol dehydrogenase family)
MTTLFDEFSTARRRFLGGAALAATASGLGTVLAPSPAAAQAAPAPSGYRPPQAPPLKDLAGKVAYVTGASSGIGLGIARAAYNAGMKVIIGYIDDSQVASALALFEDKARIHAIKHDVTDRPGWVKLADEAEKKFGRVHLLVNNAGVGIRAQVSQATHNDFDWGFGVNVGGVFNGIQTFVPRMLKYGEGAHIVTTSSMSGILPGAKAGIYTATKFASAGLMEALRIELEETNIGTSVYLPGGVNTNIRLSENYRPQALRNATPSQAIAVPPLPVPGAPPTQGPPPSGMDPLDAGQCVIEGVRNNDLFIFSHPEFRAGIQERFDAVLASVPVGRPVPQERLAIERVTMRVPLYAAETAKLQANPRR